MVRIALGCVVTLVLGTTERAHACEPAITTGELGPAWRDAVAAIGDELQQRDDIERCVTIAIERDGDAFRVVVTTGDGSVAARRVAAPSVLRAVVLALVLALAPPPVLEPPPQAPMTPTPAIEVAPTPAGVVATAPTLAARRPRVLDTIELDATSVLARNGAYDAGWLSISARAVRGGAFVGLVSRVQLGGWEPWTAGMATGASRSIEGGAELGYRVHVARIELAASCELDAIRVLDERNAGAIRFAATGRAPVMTSHRLALYAIARIGVDAISDDQILHAPVRVAPAISAGLAGEMRLWP